MAPIHTNWTRLIRFVAEETDLIHIGEPIDPDLDVGLAYYEHYPIKTYEVVGSALDPDAEVSDTILTVKELLSPLSREEVGTVRCAGLNFRGHAMELKMPRPQVPILFFKPKSSLIGPSAPIIVPKAAQPVNLHLPDFEVELTVVIGKACKNVSEFEALDYVLGYTIANDTSFRYHQMMGSQWGFSKGFDDTTPFGPCIVSPVGISDPQALRLSSNINGKTFQSSTTADHIFTLRQTISWLSQGTTLEPGSIILTGTPEGIGFSKAPPFYLRHGDEVRMFIEGLGTLINTVYEEGRETEVENVPDARL